MMPPKILFYTPSTGSRWEVYSQRLARLFFPKVERRVIRKNKKQFDPLGFVNVLLETDADYLVCLDEDCFLRGSEPLLKLIQDMDLSCETVLAGTPDGGTPYRRWNPYACNTFFMVLKVLPIRQLLVNAKDDWRKSRFEASFKRPEVFRDYLFTHDDFNFEADYERYYGFFWFLLKNGYQFKYLQVAFDPQYSATNIFYPEVASLEPSLLATHLWYVRKWRSREMDLGKLSHKDRYSLFENKVLQKILPAFWKQKIQAHLTELQTTVLSLKDEVLSFIRRDSRLCKQKFKHTGLL